MLDARGITWKNMVYTAKKSFLFPDQIPLLMSAWNEIIQKKSEQYRRLVYLYPML